MARNAERPVMISDGEECLIAFGANQGDREGMLDRVLRELERAGFEQLRPSRLYWTRPIGGPGGQAEYANAVIRAQTATTPPEAVRRLLEVERACGRRRGERWSPRTVDLDLLLLGAAEFSSADVQIPHPRMTCRRFVLEPACEVAGEMRHPWSGATLAELAESILTADRYRAICLMPEVPATERDRRYQEIRRCFDQMQTPIQVAWLDSPPGQAELHAARQGSSRGDWHILLVAESLQLQALGWRPGLVIGWPQLPGASASERQQVRFAARQFVGAAVVLESASSDGSEPTALPQSELARECSAALSAVAEFWCGPSWLSQD